MYKGVDQFNFENKLSFACGSTKKKIEKGKVALDLFEK